LDSRCPHWELLEESRVVGGASEATGIPGDRVDPRVLF
jgi:hypothetical protein